MRIYFHWNVCLFIDRKCDHCGNRRIRYPASDLSLERHPELYPFGSMGKCIGSCGVVDAGRTCSLEYDEKCRDQRGTGAVVLAGTLITYFVKKTVFESLLSTVLGKLELTEVFSNIADNHLLDVSGIILYLSLIVLFFFLTMQMIQKRRWS